MNFPNNGFPPQQNFPPQAQQPWAQPGHPQVMPPNAPIPHNAVPVNAPFPQQPPQPQWAPQPQQPQQFSGNPPPAWGAPPPQPMPGPAPAAPMQMPQANALPQFHLATPEQVEQAVHKAQADAEKAAKARAGIGTGSNMRFFSPPDHQGRTKWGKDVPVGFSSRVLVCLLPSGGAGGLPFRQATGHFRKSYAYPNGISTTCMGKGACAICHARGLLFRSGREEEVQHATDNGKPRTTAKYNLLTIEHPQLHLGQDGKMTPWIFEANPTVQAKIMRLCDEFGMFAGKAPDGSGNVVLNERGYFRALAITKTKKGTKEQDVEWDVIPRDWQPLQQQLWPALYELWDLDKLAHVPTQQEVWQALQDLRFPSDPTVMQLLYQLAPDTASQQTQPQQLPPKQPPGPPPMAQQPPQPQQFSGNPPPPPQNWGPAPGQAMQGQNPPAVPVCQHGLPSSNGWCQHAPMPPPQQPPQNPQSAPLPQLTNQLYGR